MDRSHRHQINRQQLSNLALSGSPTLPKRRDSMGYQYCEFAPIIGTRHQKIETSLLGSPNSRTQYKTPELPKTNFKADQKPQNNSKNDQQLWMICSLRNLGLDASLHLLQCLISSYSQMLSKNPSTNFNKNNCWVTNTGQVFVVSATNQHKIDEKCSKSQMQKQVSICHSIMEAILPLSSKSFQDFFTYYKRNLYRHSGCGFKYLQGLIKSYAMCLRLRPCERIPSKYLKAENMNENAVNCPLIEKQKKGNGRTVIKKSIEGRIRGGFVKEQIKKQTPTFLKKRKISLQIPNWGYGSCPFSFEKAPSHEKEIPNSCRPLSLATSNGSKQKKYKTSDLISPPKTTGKCKKSLETKGSLSSTNRNSQFTKTVEHLLSQTVDNWLNQINKSDLDVDTKTKNPKLLLPADLESVQSQSESSENQRNPILKKNQVGESQEIREYLCERAAEKNGWVMKLKDLLHTKSMHLKESFIQGKQTLQSYLTEVQQLDKFAKIVYESMVPNDFPASKSINA